MLLLPALIAPIPELAFEVIFPNKGGGFIISNPGSPMSIAQSELTPEQIAALQSSSLFNADLAPVPASGRKWRLGSFAALWVSMSACIPTYMLASSLIGGGMNWWQAVLTIFLGNLIVLIPMVL